MKQKFKNPFTKKLLKTLRKITFQIFMIYFPKYLGDFFLMELSQNNLDISAKFTKELQY